MKRQLLNHDRKALTLLSDKYYFDFNNEYMIAWHDGKFTVNSIFKEFDLNNDYVVVLLISTNYKYGTWRNERLHVVEITDKIVDVKGFYHDGKFDYWHRKSDFDEARKTAVGCYVIAQKKENLRSSKFDPLRHEFRSRDRVTVDYAYYSWNPSRTARYIYKVDLTDCIGRKIKGFTMSYAGFVSGNINEIIDKSGYNLAVYRGDLMRRVKARHAEIEKAKAQAHDFTQDVKEIDEAMEKARAAMIEALRTAKNYEDCSSIRSNLVDFAFNLKYVNDFKEKASNNSFDSLENAMKKKAGILKDFAGCL